MTKFFDFFLTPLFCRIYRFFFLSSSPSTFVFLLASLFFFSRMTHLTTPHPIAHASCPYPFLPIPPPVALVCVANPLKTLSFCAKLVSLFLLAGTLLQCLWRPQDLRPPFDAGQVAPLPPNTSTMHFLRHVALFPSQAYQPGLHFLGVFFVWSGTSAQKGASPPYPHLLFYVSSGPYPPQPPCTSYATFSLSFPSQNCCLHPNPPFFSFRP